MQVEFEAGTELIFNKNRYLLSYSTVKMIGDKNNPITIKSTDGTGSGFTILQANHTSKLEYVNFDGLNTFDNNNWILTGAVTFYESDVEISHCSFSNNHCEDALNIIRSKNYSFFFESLYLSLKFLASNSIMSDIFLINIPVIVCL